MNRCWLVYSEDILPMGIEEDYWVENDATIRYNALCLQYPFAEIFLYTVYDRDEPSEKWVENRKQLAAFKNE